MRENFLKMRLLATTLLLAAGLAVAAERFDVAVTVDDLTAHGTLPKGATRTGIAASYLATLKAHGVPEAYGFVNAKRIGEEPASEAVLDLWRTAGYPLGNHTYSHMNIDQAPSLEAWLADVRAGEPAIESRMRGGDWRYLRYPFLSAGADQARHDGALAYLKTSGYRIADVTVSFNDWAYTDAYARCLAKGDATAIDAMKVEYFQGVDAEIARMKALSLRLYGRVIPQVLLTHLGGWSAATLPQVMARLDAAGARYVPLAQAQADPAYQQASRRAGDGLLMQRSANDKAISLADLPPQAATGDVDKLCR
jgi:peptidoglycan/xylan/chitin deacetylase (PgdA/CDA1 family)